MAVTENNYVGDGSTVLFSITFPYLEQSDVLVSLDDTTTTAFSFATDTQIQMDSAPASGAEIRIYRSTNIDDQEVVFSPGSSIRAQDLNANYLQTLYVTQEISNNAVLTDGSNSFAGDLNMGGNQVINLGAPNNDSDAVTKQYVDTRLSDTDIPGYTRWRTTATDSQTVFSGSGESGGTLQYSSGRENIYVNGVLQQRGVDYTETEGITVTFNTALTAGDVVDIVCVNNLSIAIDWYEEGTWTPAVTFGGVGVGQSYSYQQGFYQRIGNTVHATGSLVLTDKGSSTGTARLIGLPFVAASDPINVPAVFIPMTGFTGITGAATLLQIEAGDQTAIFHVFSGGSGVNALTDANFTNTTSIGFSLTYLV